MRVIEKINGPEDVKKCSVEELETLATEMRELLLNRVSQIGGHVGPNLGVVELTIALHKVFDSPKDKIVWDVSHQSYPHKMLTGRKNAYETGHFEETSGYTSPEESEHDFFTVGHTSTSISLATGLATARDIKGESHNVVGIIGDGSLSGGLSFEGLNNASMLNSNLILIVNDNEMSIDENYGGLYKNLRELRESGGECANNYFRIFGFEYRYVEEGNDLTTLIDALNSVKDTTQPVVLHLHTEKGHGYLPAVENKLAFHWHAPFETATGETKGGNSTPNESYNDIMVKYISDKIEQGEPVIAVHAALPGAFGIKKIQKNYPKHFLDVGIAEQHSISFGTAFAKAGGRPFIFHSSTFLQRAYDQLSHDLAINQNPAIVIVKGGVISDSDQTHQGTFDIPYLRSIPNLVFLAPNSAEDLLAMLDWAYGQTEQAVVIRLPEHGVEHRENTISDYSVAKYQVLHEGSQVALLGLGGMLANAKKVHALLGEHGIDATLINPMTISSVDEECLDALFDAHELVVTLEDGSLEGGFGEGIAAYYGPSEMKVLNYGSWKEFVETVPVDELYTKYRLKPELIIEDIHEVFEGEA